MAKGIDLIRKHVANRFAVGSTPHDFEPEGGESFVPNEMDWWRMDVWTRFWYKYRSQIKKSVNASKNLGL